jgi:competence protein ComEC
MNPSKILFYFCLSFIFGIFISSLLGFLPGSRIYFLLPGLIVAIFLILFSWRYEKLMFFGFCILFLVLGIWRHQAVLLEIENSKIKNFIGQNIILTGLVDKEPDIREKIARLEIKIEKIKKINNQEENSSPELGKILITTIKYPEYKYGDKLVIQGILKTPDILEGFNYKDYLAKDGIFSVMDFPEIEKAKGNFGNFFLKLIFSFKNKLNESLNRGLPRPESAILEALLFGEEQNFSEDLKEKFNLTGTRHLAAVSGMNITIVSAILVSFLLLLGFWRQQAFYFAIIILISYILMVGAPASALRAGIMAILFLTSQHFGRLSSASRLMLFAATIMLVINPLLLKLDVGFQLSFLAVMGLIFLQPFFSELFKKIPDNFQLRTSLASTLSAQIFVLPLLVYNFGQVSLISPLINILILPLIPFITIFGFIFSFIGIFFQSLARILFWLVYFMLAYIIKTVDFFSKFSFASINFKNVSWVWLIIFYFILIIIVRKIHIRITRPIFLR